LSELSKRIITAVIFLPVLVCLATIGRIYYVILVEIGIILGTYEFFKILEARGLQPYKKLGILAGVLLGLVCYYKSYIFTMFVLTCLILVLSVSELTRKKVEHAIYHMSGTVFGMLYVSWLFSHLILLREIPKFLHYRFDYDMGISFSLLPFLIAWINDTFAYFGGRRYGRNPLFPRVSPKKTWEGAITGALSVLITLFLIKWISGCGSGQELSLKFLTSFYHLFRYYLTWYDCVILGIFGPLLAVVGDLVESLLKRDASLKDASKIIPGHGGILDRFDSILFVAPFVYYYLRFVVLQR